ncbi:polysaccharide biosynthesis/export family protein [Caenimonas koreensis]|uniref:polysaccharide biosynthesis/export family protein n=1 Tax=Caenimonas koreensis TaxID=367474 RepID=UPI003784CCE2
MFVVRTKIIFICTAVLAAVQCHAQGSQAETSGATKPAPFQASQAGAAGSSVASAPQFQTTAPSALPLATIAKDYRLSPSDLIEVEVFEMENLKRTVRVNAAGNVSLPLIGSIGIGGLTVPEAESKIAQKYAEKYLQDPQVSLFVKEFTTERITIEGAVSRPGVVPLSGPMTLLRILAISGGFGPIANTSEVMIYRVNENNVRQVAVFDVEQIRAGKAEDPVVKGDDLIVVQRDKTRALLKDSIFRDVIDSINPFSALVPK